MAEIKIVRGTGRAPVPSRPIKRQERQPDGPHRNPAGGTPIRTSNADAAKAVRTAKNPPGIDGRQQRF